MGTTAMRGVTGLAVVGAALLSGCTAPGGHGGGVATDVALRELEWMAGSWVSPSEDGLVTEEYWTPPRGGTMLGVSRATREGKTVSYEFLRIEQREDGVYYVASPQGRGSTDFRRVSDEGRRAVFENPQHDFPQRISYWTRGDGGLSARIEGELRGRTASEQWDWVRASGR